MIEYGNNTNQWPFILATFSHLASLLPSGSSKEDTYEFVFDRCNCAAKTALALLVNGFHGLNGFHVRVNRGSEQRQSLIYLVWLPSAVVASALQRLSRLLKLVDSKDVVFVKI